MIRTKPKAIDRGAINCIPVKKKKESNENGKISKFQSMSKLIVNKLDDILSQYPGHDQFKIIPKSNSIADANTNANTNSHSLSKISLQNSEHGPYILDDLRIFDESYQQSYSFQKENSIKETTEPMFPQLPQLKLAKNGSKKELNKVKKKKKKGPFITDVENDNKKDKLLQSNTQEIDDNETKMKDVFKEINDIESMFKDEGKPSSSSSFNSKMRTEVEEFKSLLNEIEEYKKDIQEDFDEVQYLIKFADKTRTMINRHKNVVTNIFKQAGIEPQVREEESDKENHQHESEDEDEIEIDTVMKKTRRIGHIKDNLSNIQEGIMGYHEKLNRKLNEIINKNNVNEK